MLQDFVGNKDVIDELNKNIKSNDIFHTYLFVGSEGVGKFTIAKSFAKMILCNENNTKGFCREIFKYEHPDLIILRGENSIKKAQIENLISDSYKKPFESKYKVFIIDEFDKVTISAQNAILKSLEEPQEYVKFILTSKNIAKILPTISSRCRIIKFHDIDNLDIEKFLIEKVKTNEKNAKLFSNIACGSLNRAILYANEPKFLNLRNDSLEVFNRILNIKSKYPFREQSFFSNNQENINEIFNIYITFLRDIAIYNMNNKNNLINIDKIKLIKEQNINIKKLLKIKNLIIYTLELIQNNINYELAIGGFLINMEEIVNGHSWSQI